MCFEWEKKDKTTIDCKNNKCTYCKGPLTSSNDIAKCAHEFCMQAIKEQKKIPPLIENWVDQLKN